MRRGSLLKQLLVTVLWHCNQSKKFIFGKGFMVGGKKRPREGRGIY